MRITTNPVGGDAEPWDPAAPSPFTSLAGSRFEGTQGENALFRTWDGDLMAVLPGWLVIRLEGQEPFISAPYHLGGPEVTYSAAG